MKSHFFAYISRMRFIQRWALMRNTAPENVQEHSHQVAVLAHALAVIRNEKFGGRLDPGAVAVAALYHDASEILTGDMPTPIKYDNPAIRNAYKDVEAVAEGKLLHMLPPELQGVYGPILTQSDPEVRQVVKAADKLSAYIKCVEELKAGNNEFRQAAGQTRKALEGYELPEVTYFLETFMDSFSLTLDELQWTKNPPRGPPPAPGACRGLAVACGSLFGTGLTDTFRNLPPSLYRVSIKSRGQKTANMSTDTLLVAVILTTFKVI